MKRFFFVSIVTLLVALAVALPARANVNNFVITSYDIKMQLGRDEEKLSTLQTTETITAEFLQQNVNRGIERAIPKAYDGHSTSLKVQSVKDESGIPIEYSTYYSNDNTVVRIGDPDRYVYGKHTYVIQYTQRDVTRHFDDTAKDELYWDTNGTQWRVPIEKLQVHLAIDKSLQDATTGDAACYQGSEGSTDRCSLDANSGIYEVSTQSLLPGENVTIAIGFEPGTFAEYEQPLIMKLISIWLVIQIFASLIGVGLIVGFSVKAWRAVNRSRELGFITPEYLPPSETSVTTSSRIAKGVKGSVMTAQLIDLAVRHYIKLYEVKEKTLFTPAEYEIEVTKDPSDLLPEEQELLKDMFGALPSLSQRMSLKSLQNNMSYFSRTTDNDKKLASLVRKDYGLKARDERLKRWFTRAAIFSAILAALMLSPLIIIAAGLALILAYSSYPLTDKGLALRRYLEGLKLYIGVAETERLKMLQSPDGVQKTGGTDEKSLLKLYERVLPYAVLFNQEKEWTKHLGRYYENTGTQPDWYSGHAAFSAAMFSSSMSSLSQAASYTSSSSSSSGGSMGGGSSGGGGGGGW